MSGDLTGLCQYIYNLNLICNKCGIFFNQTDVGEQNLSSIQIATVLLFHKILHAFTFQFN